VSFGYYLSLNNRVKNKKGKNEKQEYNFKT